MQFKKILSFCFIFALLSVPVYAKWDNFGVDAGIYIDTDTISDFGSTMSFSYKFTNELLLNKLSETVNVPALSVCHLRANVSCPSGEKLYSKLTCYDDSGNVIINEKEFTYENNPDPDPKICKNLKKVKRYRKYNLI